MKKSELTELFCFRIYIMEINEIVRIYNKRLNKYWECSYGAFLNNWSKFGWVIIDSSKQNNMSKTAVKTTYSVEGAYGSIDIEELYCIHNHSSDCTTFYRKDGSIQEMVLEEWETNNDLWDAMNRLWYPFKGEWGRSKLKDGVEFFGETPWEVGE